MAYNQRQLVHRAMADLLAVDVLLADAAAVLDNYTAGPMVEQVPLWQAQITEERRQAAATRDMISRALSDRVNR